MPDTALPILTLTSTQDVLTDSMAGAAFRETAVREGLRHLRRASFPVGSVTLTDLMSVGAVELAEQLPVGASVLVRPAADTLAYLHATRGNAELWVAGRGRGEVDRSTASIVATLREPADREDEDRVAVSFWAAGFGPASAPRRRIAAASWDQIASNYASRTRAALDSLMAATEPGPGGLVLWHGEPGTGKSHALRALIREWRGWCDAHFVTDPEALLGAQANYLLGKLLRTRHDRARLIILEDAGELLSADARAIAGQAVSRLLNISDGLLGAGLRAIVLVTTNEPLRRLHPAVVRPGRCWAQVEFTELSAAESDDWLARRSPPAAAVGRACTLAELFATADRRPVGVRPAIGFGAR